MLHQALTVLLDKPDPVAAWKHLVGPNDVVGIKSKVWHHAPSPKAVEETIGKHLLNAGVKKEDRAAHDRGVRRNPVFARATARSIQNLAVRTEKGHAPPVAHFFCLNRRPALIADSFSVDLQDGLK